MNNVQQSVEQDPRLYFAAERTFLAWIRTGLALMGIGFAVSRFGLFLRELAATDSAIHLRSTGMPTRSGIALVALGVIVNVLATVRHIRTVRELRTNTWIAGRISTEAVVLAVILTAMGVGMGIYLAAVR